MAARTHDTDETTAAEVLGLLAGTGIVLMQAAAVIPGLLPVLILLLPLVLPIAVLGLVGGVVVGVPYGLWRLLASALRPMIRRRAIPAGEARGFRAPGDLEANTEPSRALPVN
jgi:hypothetical protein